MSYPTIDPCPHCGSKRPWAQHGADASTYYVKCSTLTGCGLQGPVCKNDETRDAEDLAIDAWNDVARAVANWRQVQVSADRVLEVSRG